MPIALSCDSCGRGLRVRDELAGKQIYCPDCKSILTVPGTSVQYLPDDEEVPMATAAPPQCRDAYSDRAEEPSLRRAERPRIEDRDNVPQLPLPPSTSSINLGAVIGGLVLMVVSGVILLVMIGGFVGAVGGLIKLVIVLFIAGIATFIRGLMGKSD